jgi:hypothetical protein
MVKRIALKRKSASIIAFTCILILSLFIFFFTTISASGSGYLSIKAAHALELNGSAQEHRIYLPLVFNINPSVVPTVNIPTIENVQSDWFPEEAAVIWFGKVTPTDNYSDIRIGYFQSALWVWISIIDRRLWYDESPSPEDLTKWDAVSLFLNIDDNGNNFTFDNTLRFDSQLYGGEPNRNNWQAAYHASNEGWMISPINFETHTNWWSMEGGLNDDSDDRAWVAEYIIPFQSLGLSGPPPEGTEWRMGFELHDRDDFNGAQIPDKAWPEYMLPNKPVTWAIAHAGLPGYVPPQSSNPQTYTLRNGLNGITITDGMVGGDTICGDGLDFWSQWGDTSYPGTRHFNIQNQGNTDDWPCFSKTYITIPLDSLPRGMEVISATITVHQIGQATGPSDDPPKALNTLIQIWEINQDWDPFTLTWNNAPAPFENLSQGWVGAIDESQLGIPRYLDVSLAATRAYAAGKPLRLALYSADFYGGHGKYFFSSSSEDYDGNWRPSLTITLGNP